MQAYFNIPRGMGEDRAKEKWEAAKIHSRSEVRIPNSWDLLPHSSRTFLSSVLDWMPLVTATLNSSPVRWNNGRVLLVGRWASKVVWFSASGMVSRTLFSYFSRLYPPWVRFAPLHSCAMAVSSFQAINFLGLLSVRDASVEKAAFSRAPAGLSWLVYPLWSQ